MPSGVADEQSFDEESALHVLDDDVAVGWAVVKACEVVRVEAKKTAANARQKKTKDRRGKLFMIGLFVFSVGSIRWKWTVSCVCDCSVVLWRGTATGSL